MERVEGIEPYSAQLGRLATHLVLTRIISGRYGRIRTLAVLSESVLETDAFNHSATYLLNLLETVVGFEPTVMYSFAGYCIRPLCHTVSNKLNKKAPDFSGALLHLTLSYSKDTVTFTHCTAHWNPPATFSTNFPASNLFHLKLLIILYKVLSFSFLSQPVISLLYVIFICLVNTFLKIFLKKTK